MKLPLGQYVLKRIHDVPLAAPVEPDIIGFAQDFNELFRVRDFGIVRMQHTDVLKSEPSFPRTNNVFFLVDFDLAVLRLVAIGGWHNNDLGPQAARPVDERFHDSCATIITAPNNH